MSPEDRKRSKELLPLLNKLGEEHPDHAVKAMALDLRFAIATHGFLLTTQPQRDTDAKRKSQAPSTSSASSQSGKKPEKTANTTKGAKKISNLEKV